MREPKQNPQVARAHDAVCTQIINEANRRRREEKKATFRAWYLQQQAARRAQNTS